MGNIEKAQILIRRAPTDKKNVALYEKALLSLSKLEREAGDEESSDFIRNELMEALFVTVGEK